MGTYVFFSIAKFVCNEASFLRRYSYAVGVAVGATIVVCPSSVVRNGCIVAKL